MKVKVQVEMDVGEFPVADAITYFVSEHGWTQGDDAFSPEEWVSSMVYTVLNKHTPPEWYVEKIEVTTKETRDGR